MSKVVCEVSRYCWHFGQIIFCCTGDLCMGRCLAAPWPLPTKKSMAVDSRHTQNIQINKVIGENEKRLLFYRKKKYGLVGQHSISMPEISTHLPRLHGREPEYSRHTVHIHINPSRILGTFSLDMFFLILSLCLLELFYYISLFKWFSVFYIPSFFWKDDITTQKKYSLPSDLDKYITLLGFPPSLPSFFLRAIEGKAQWFPIHPLTPRTHSLPISNIPQYSGTFFTTDEPTLTCHHHPESIVYIPIYSWYYTSGFGQIYNDI